MTHHAPPDNLKKIFVALDRLGVPDDFLSPTERDQHPSQERSDLLHPEAENA